MIGDNKPPSFKEAFLFWLKLGFISFGGPAGQIAIMHQFLVEKKKWISDSKFLHALNYCMLLPGPEAQQLATYTGWLLHGVRGGLVAGILFVLPSVFIMLGLSIVYVLFGDQPVVSSMLNGLKPAVIAIIIVALIRIGKKSLKNWMYYLIAILSFIAITFLNIPFPIIIICALIIGFAVRYKYSALLDKSNSEEMQASLEEGFYINSSSVIPHSGFDGMRILKQLFFGLLLWAFPFVLIGLFIYDTQFWLYMGMFFSKAALVTFGGAYAILPYVAQISVEKFHWLTELQMLDGLALGETTPGPLIMVLAFVGFMGGYNHYNFSVFYGTIGLLLTVWFTFLPSFLFVLIGAPVIERTQNNPRIKMLLSVVSAAVVGVILSLCIYLGKAVIFEGGSSFQNINWFNISWVVISFFAMIRFKVNIVLWIVISALVGLGYYLLFS
ncbi:MAG: chromate transporter [Bacteroidetes bacterium]|jgi:chromate transporter|nr:chromate transporter [Bacteroidota bacterium]